MISFKQRGNFKITSTFLNKSLKININNILEKYGKEGARALSAATPIDSGETAKSWSYEVAIKKDTSTVAWTNSNMTADGTPIAILIQYGHGTRNGGYVPGRDYINPALRPVLDSLANEAWKEISGL